MLGDVDIRDPLFFLQFQHQVNQLRAHRHIQRGKRFIRNDHFWPQNQRTRQTQTLFLAWCQHMRVVAFVIRQQPNHTQGFKYALTARLWLQVGVQTQRKIEDLRNALARVKRGRRILEDHADALAAERVVAERQRMIVNQHFACSRFNHAGEHFRQGGFPGTVLADDRQGLFFTQRKAQRLHRVDSLTMKQPRAVAKGLTQVADFQ